MQIGDNSKLININRTWQRIYDLKSLSNRLYPIQLLCDTQIYNNRRRIILSSIVQVDDLMIF